MASPSKYKIPNPSNPTLPKNPVSFDFLFDHSKGAAIHSKSTSSFPIIHSTLSCKTNLSLMLNLRHLPPNLLHRLHLAYIVRKSKRGRNLYILLLHYRTIRTYPRKIVSFLFLLLHFSDSLDVFKMIGIISFQPLNCFFIPNLLVVFDFIKKEFALSC